MKRIHIRKPDIKGFFVKIRNLKKEDIKRHFQEKKERRRRILEERRNSRFARKMQPVYKWMNRLSLNPLHHIDWFGLASMMIAQHCVGYMKEKGWGRIVTIGSVQEMKPHPEMLVYSSSKCAQRGMVRSLAGQLAKYRITVNNVAPGVIYTDRNKEALADESYAKSVMDSIPLGYYGEKEDLAGIVRLLCSEQGRYITGQSIFVDGGKSL